MTDVDCKMYHISKPSMFPPGIGLNWGGGGGGRPPPPPPHGPGTLPSLLENTKIRSVQHAHSFMHNNIQVAKPRVFPVFIILQGKMGLCYFNGVMSICMCICSAVIHFVQNAGFFH
jgi:hypothetical protein